MRIECKDCVYCTRDKWDGSNRSAFRQGDDYLYWCHKFDRYVIETDSCRFATDKE